uniref:C2H2-type domain-containing protein n=1 Tax=Rhodosorus marinus TaxID=101924 RepID=A0A7S0G3Q6_9RHOD|mmetsp:Transcript_3364/g.4825  ORF Transcript_3364/g.4825 Transcript_3364/m.4825 type:complete len:147 (+) Transcript_3364:247-687(+)|eukprot:CAMPEP_0184738650 /NCGR_PEP_ID=MMETSP0315-20130426/1292_1 /TAXON_ID=101924 /ORGANISM="Rhodosorus marinus, Strain UTEX LB 2760" /LENGTH=146 /DNA_ID=CAMNT_0027206503 /DNA_START=186 /DNA_END=626 /DNA_ORIENTATION=-
MRRILVEVREGKGRVFVCPVEGCRKESSRKYNIQAHMRIHTEQTPYICVFSGCGMSFKWRSSLVNHERYHKRDGSCQEVQEKMDVKADDVNNGNTLDRVLSSSSAVTVESNDCNQNTVEDEREQFYVAVILAENLHKGGQLGSACV